MRILIKLNQINTISKQLGFWVLGFSFKVSGAGPSRGVRPALFRWLVERHAENNSTNYAVLLVDHLRRYELSLIKCGFLSQCVEHEHLPVFRTLVLLYENEQRGAAIRSTRRLAYRALSTVFEDERDACRCDDCLD